MSGLIPVSVVVCTRDEEANIAACLGALRRFAQVMVVDSESGDGTVRLALAEGAELIRFRWDGRYPKKKAWCLQHLPFRHPWVLYVDADEVVTAGLAEEIARLMRAGPRHAGYFITGRYVFLGRTLRFGHRNAKLALIDRQRTRFPVCDDLDLPGGWEVEGHYQPIVDGPVGRLRHPMLHADRKPLAAWFDRHNRYSDWEAGLQARGRLAALLRHESGRRRWLKRIFRGLPCRGLAAFLHSYLFRLGFLDGAAGFHFAVARGFYYWQIGLKRREQALAAAIALGGGVAEPGMQRRPAAAEGEGGALDQGDGGDGKGGQPQQVAPQPCLLGAAEPGPPV